MHTPGAQVLKSMHPAAKMCTQGAGCTLNFDCLISYGLSHMPTACYTSLRFVTRVESLYVTERLQPRPG